MPSKLKKALGAVKDQTSISIAKVSGTSANLEVAILKATTHDEVPVDERYIAEIVQLVSSDKAYAAGCANAIGRRITKTRNWVVAVKSLTIVLRVFQDGDPYFPGEVLHAMKRGNKILNLSNFRDDSNSKPWDYTAFVRTFALYLDERLNCFLTGKLQRRFSYQKSEISYHLRRGVEGPVKEIKPAALLDKIPHWQKLLDRALATRPTGSAKTNKLVQISLYAVAQESFDLYRDISDGLALLLDSFFHLQYQSCVNAFQACVKATKQFEELGSFYDLCKSLGVGRTSEYPSVQKLSDELIETLQEFLKDRSSFPSLGRSPSSAPPSRSRGPGTEHVDAVDRSEPPEKESDQFSRTNSVDDLISGTDSRTSPARSTELEQERFSKQSEKQQMEDFISAIDTESSHSFPPHQGASSGLDLFRLDDWPAQHDGEEKRSSGFSDGWELFSAQTRSQSIPKSRSLDDLFDHSIVDGSFNQSSDAQRIYNPFLQDIHDIPSFPNTSPATTASDLDLSLFTAGPSVFQQNADGTVIAPAFQADSSAEMALAIVPAAAAESSITTVVPTFCANDAETFSAQNQKKIASSTASESDPFAWGIAGSQENRSDPFAESHGAGNRDSYLAEQEQWLKNQNRIIASQTHDLIFH